MAFVADTMQLGDATITRVAETDLLFSTDTFIRQPSTVLDPYLTWLKPFLGADNQLRMVVQALLVHVDGLRLIVDTCVGNGKNFGANMTMFNNLDTPFIERLTAAGFAPDAIDYVICTHLHVDHVGWNTRLMDGVWVPTFPNARYLLAVDDIAHWSKTEAPHNPFGISVRPVLDAGLVDAVAAPHRVSASVELFPTPGHTPGHMSVRLTSRGHTAVITGDMVHSPVQFARPEWSSVADTDGEQAAASRRSLLAEVGGRDVLVIGTHFPDPTAGHVVADTFGWKFV